MSIDYEVIVPGDRWPTFADANRALRARGFPVEIVPGKSMASDEPIQNVARTLGMLVRVNRTPLELQVFVGPFSDPIRADDETNETLEMIGAEIRARPGDYQFSVGLHSSPDEWTAASYIMAVLVLDFGGYGYELQAESHGRDPWAFDLIEAARQGFASPLTARVQSEAPVSVNQVPTRKWISNPRPFRGENLFWLVAFVLAAIVGFALSEFSHAKHQ